MVYDTEEELVIDSHLTFKEDPQQIRWRVRELLEEGDLE